MRRADAARETRLAAGDPSARDSGAREQGTAKAGFPLPAIVLATVLLACGACRTICRDGTTNSDAVSTIEQIVRAQESAWNRGDIEGFMSAGYQRSPDLTFFSGGSVTQGFDPVLARYTKRYKAEGKEMGQLAFTKLEVLPLAEDVALARGRWDLDFAQEKDVGGLFSLVLRHTADGWRIVHDHTSVDG